MGRFEEAKLVIDANITENGNQSITGSVLNIVLTEMNKASSEEHALLSQEWQEIKEADFTINPHTEKVVLTDNEVFLDPDKFYTWDAPQASLMIGLNPPIKETYVGKYSFQFTCPENASTYLNLPVGIVWNGQPDFKPGGTYQVFIFDKLAIFFTDPKIDEGFVTAEEVQAMIDGSIVSALNTEV